MPTKRLKVLNHMVMSVEYSKRENFLIFINMRRTISIATFPAYYHHYLKKYINMWSTVNA